MIAMQYHINLIHHSCQGYWYMCLLCAYYTDFPTCVVPSDARQ